MNPGPAMWGGRFEAPPDEAFRRFNDSLRFDWRLVTHDIHASGAWARALRGAGVLTAEEADTLASALTRVHDEARALAAPPLESGAEDVHSWVESRLIALVGPLGKKLHTGRSRNDQVATDLRLWTIEALSHRFEEARLLAMRLAERAALYAHDPMPAYTHLQPAQPIVAGHWCLAYAEMFERDLARFARAIEAAAVCPLGSAALAGTTYPVDREALARELSMRAPTRNSLDAVSDRDFVLDALAAAAACAVHLSRFAEDLIIYATAEFALVRLPDALTSGSSLMPQKKNPDALELIRGKCGRIAAAHATLLMTLKGLPLAYNKDMQEDKEPLFAAMDELSSCLTMGVRVAESLEFDRAACAAAARRGHTNATELADYLVGLGLPFRDAHEAAGRLVLAAIAKGCQLDDLPLADYHAVVPAVTDSVYRAITIEAGLARRDVPGGTAPARVAHAAAEARQRLAAARPR